MKALLALFLLTSTLAVNAQQQAPASMTPTLENFREWVSYIRPEGDEESWRVIPWRNGFMPAVKEAQSLDRPILLWAMNGNPCGET